MLLQELAGKQEDNVVEFKARLGKLLSCWATVGSGVGAAAAADGCSILVNHLIGETNISWNMYKSCFIVI